MARKLALLFIITTVFLMSGSYQVQAQSEAFVIVNHVAVEERPDNLGVQVFFTVTDGNGRPIPEPNIEEASVQLLGSGNREPIPAIIEDPRSPVFIALLMDTSGSMADVMDQVRSGAQLAIDGAPPTNYFAVITFNETSTRIQDFTNNQIRVKDAIQGIEAIPNRGTCLYDTVYDAVFALEDQIQSPQERRAIILFTDGQDQLQLDSPEQCSRHTYQDVVSIARPSANPVTITPIHTIGIFDQSASELNEPELRSLASETNAFSVVGNQANLGALFQDIIAGLNSQLVARSLLFPEQGENQAVLSLKIRDIETPLSTTFNFTSSRDYDIPPPTPEVRFIDRQYDAQTKRYRLSLSAINPDGLRQILIRVHSDERGVDLFTEAVVPDATVVVEIDAATFEEGTYQFQLLAEGRDGFLLTNEDDEEILDEVEVNHKLPEGATAVEFSIQSINADFENGQLLINLDLLEPQRIQSYQGFIVDEETGGRIHDFGPGPFTGMQIQETLPDNIKLAETPGSYRVTVYLTTQELLRSEASFDDFRPIPPPPDPFMTRVIAALQGNPEFLIIIGVIVLSIVGWWGISRRKARKSVPTVRPPVDKTYVFDPNQPQSSAAPWLANEKEMFGGTLVSSLEPQQPRIRIQLNRLFESVQSREEIITKFPCVIGRENCDFIIEGDQRISRRHAQIGHQGEGFYVMDLGSVNGTKINGRKMTPNEPIPFNEKITLDLSTHTQLEIEPL